MLAIQPTFSDYPTSFPLSLLAVPVIAESSCDCRLTKRALALLAELLDPAVQTLDRPHTPKATKSNKHAVLVANPMLEEFYGISLKSLPKNHLLKMTLMKQWEIGRLARWRNWIDNVVLTKLLQDDQRKARRRQFLSRLASHSWARHHQSPSSVTVMPCFINAFERKAHCRSLRHEKWNVRTRLKRFEINDPSHTSRKPCSDRAHSEKLVMAAKATRSEALSLLLKARLGRNRKRDGDGGNNLSCLNSIPYYYSSNPSTATMSDDLKGKTMESHRATICGSFNQGALVASFNCIRDQEVAQGKLDDARESLYESVVHRMKSNATDDHVARRLARQLEIIEDAF